MNRPILLLFLVMAFWAGRAEALEAEGIDIHGFISQGYLQSDANNYLADSEDGTFQFNEMGINFGKELTEKLHVGIQFFARDQGPIGNNEVVIDWAYADYHWKDWAGVRVGLMRIVQGFYNETRDMDMLRTGILLPQSVYNENQREFFSRIQGLGLYGEIPAGAAGSFSYQVMAGTMNVDEDGGIARQAEASGIFEIEKFKEGTVYNADLQWQTPVNGLRMGVTGFRTTDIDAEMRTTISMGPMMPSGTKLESEMEDFHTLVFSAEYTWKNLVVFGEYLDLKRESVVRNLGATSVRSVQDPVGYYIGTAYRFTDRFELGAYYSEYYSDEDDKDGDEQVALGQPDYRAWQKDLALTTRFDISEHWIVKLEGHVMEGTALLFSQDNSDTPDEDWFILAAKVTFSF